MAAAVASWPRRNVHCPRGKHHAAVSRGQAHSWHRISQTVTLLTMTETQPDRDATAAKLPLLPYHMELLTYLRREHTDLWDWFVSNPVRTRHADSVRLALLRSAYRIERSDDNRLYKVVDDVSQQMAMHVPVTLYQAQTSDGRNASLAWLPDEAHIVLHGNIQELLSDSELHALFSHELAHHELYSIDESAFLAVEQVLSAMLNDRTAQPVHTETWRAFRLYTELYCDRRALDVAERLDDVISVLVKMETGLKEVSASAYLTQAEEILSSDSGESEQTTHPEMYIRAKALAAWHEDKQSADRIIRPLIEGPLALSKLDLLRQAQLQQLTEQFVREFLKPGWLQTRVILGHVRRLFPDFDWKSGGEQVATESAGPLLDLTEDHQIHQYLCYLLLDFVTVDPDLEDAPLAAAFLFADRHDLEEQFTNLAAKELRLGKRHFQRIRSQAKEMTAVAEQEFAE